MMIPALVRTGWRDRHWARARQFRSRVARLWTPCTRYYPLHNFPRIPNGTRWPRPPHNGQHSPRSHSYCDYSRIARLPVPDRWPSSPQGCLHTPTRRWFGPPRLPDWARIRWKIGDVTACKSPKVECHFFPKSSATLHPKVEKSREISRAIS